MSDIFNALIKLRDKVEHNNNEKRGLILKVSDLKQFSELKDYEELQRIPNHEILYGTDIKQAVDSYWKIKEQANE